MRNAKEMRMEKLMELLSKMGLSTNQLVQAEAYLTGETERLNFAGAQKTDANSIDYRVSDAMEKTFVKLMKNKAYDEVFRLFDLLFALFDHVAKLFPLSEFYELKKDEAFASKMPRDKMVAMLAAFYNESGIVCGQMRSMWETSGKNFEVLEDALALCRQDDAVGQLAIYNTYFYYLNQEQQAKTSESGETVTKKQGKNWGILGGLSKVFAAQAKQEPRQQEAGKKRIYTYTQKQEEMFTRYEDIIVHNSGSVFQTITEEDRKRVSSFVRNHQDKADIPADILAIADKYPIFAGQSYARMPRILLGSCAANLKASRLFRNFIRLCAYGKNFGSTMECVWRAGAEYNMGGNELAKLVCTWKDELSLDSVKLICWCGQTSNSGFEQVLLEFADREPDMYRRAMDEAQVNVSSKLSELIKRERPKLYKKHYKENGGKRDEMRQQLAMKLAETVGEPERAAVTDYLLEGDGAESLYSMENALAVSNKYYYSQSHSLIMNYGSMIGHDDFYKRCVVFMCVRKNYNGLLRFFSKDGWSQFKADRLKELFRDIADAGVTVARQWQAAAGMEDSIYTGTLKDSFSKVIRDIFSGYLETDEEVCVAAFAAGPAVSRVWAIEIFGARGETYKSQIFSYFGDSSKLVKEAMMKQLSSHREWMPDVVEKLTSGKASERELAVAVLGQSGGDYTAELQAALDKEKSSKVAGAIRAVLGKGADTGSDGEEDIDSYIREMHKGGRKRSLAWAYETPFVAVHMQTQEHASGEAVADEAYMQAILLAYASMPVPGVNREVLRLTEGLNQSELAQYVTELFDKWIETGAEAKKKWVLYVAGIHGGAQIVDLMKHQIDEWAKNSRGAIAAEAVKALALNSSPTALLMVDGIARKYKFKQVRAAAGKALEFAAEQLGLSTEELADRIVPDLGFNAQHERIFDYGGRKFKVYITPALEIEIYDENEKKLKNMPAPGKRDDEALAAEAYAEFKQMKKQMKATVANQKLRLEAALSTERKWKADRWRALFVENPIMHQFAISLIWGVYGEDGALLATFRYMEDGSFNTEDEEEYQLPEQGMIGLIHPIEINEESKAKWEEQLSDYEITQSVEQLGRPVFAMTKEEGNAKSLERFGGAVLAAVSLSGRLQTLGWYKASAEDAGMYYYFYRQDAGLGIEVRLNFSGAYIGDSYMAAENEEVTVYDAEFYKKASEGEKEKKLTLGALSPKYFSEIVYQLTKATAGAEEWDENWKTGR